MKKLQHKIVNWYRSWKFILTYWYKPSVIEGQIRSSLRYVHAYEHRIRHLKNVIAIQQRECENLSETMEKAGARIIELQEARDSAVSLLKRELEK